MNTYKFKIRFCGALCGIYTISAENEKDAVDIMKRDYNFDYLYLIENNGILKCVAEKH